MNFSCSVDTEQIRIRRPTMAEILKNGQVHNDHWQVLHLEADVDPAAQAVTAGQWLVPFNVWIAQRDRKSVV